MGDICSDFYREDSTMETKHQEAFTSSFDDLLDHVRRLHTKDQKDLAEDILQRLTEEGWECHWDSLYLSATKTEAL